MYLWCSKWNCYISFYFNCIRPFFFGGGGRGRQSIFCSIRLIFVQYRNGNYSYGKRVTLSYIFNGKLCDQMCIFLLLFGFFYAYIYFRYKSLHLSSGSFKSILTIHYGILLFPNMVSLKGKTSQWCAWVTKSVGILIMEYICSVLDNFFLYG